MINLGKEDRFYFDGYVKEYGKFYPIKCIKKYSLCIGDIICPNITLPSNEKFVEEINSITKSKE